MIFLLYAWYIMCRLVIGLLDLLPTGKIDEVKAAADDGEQAVVDALAAAGYTAVVRSPLTPPSSGKYDDGHELDLARVMRRFVIFVEVKLWAGSLHPTGEVNGKGQRLITQIPLYGDPREKVHPMNQVQQTIAQFQQFEPSLASCIPVVCFAGDPQRLDYSAIREPGMVHISQLPQYLQGLAFQLGLSSTEADEETLKVVQGLPTWDTVDTNTEQWYGALDGELRYQSQRGREKLFLRYVRNIEF